MPRSKKPRAELIRVAPQMDLATLDALIQKRVAEAQVSQGAILEPWFQSKAVADAIRRHQNIFHVRKWALYFERHGCLICGKKRVPHHANGMCHTCFDRTVARLRALERDYAKAHPQEFEE